MVKEPRSLQRTSILTSSRWVQSQLDGVVLYGHVEVLKLLPLLQQVPTVTTDDFVNFAADKPEKKSRVINLSQYGPTYFGPEHAQV